MKHAHNPAIWQSTNVGRVILPQNTGSVCRIEKSWVNLISSKKYSSQVQIHHSNNALATDIPMIEGLVDFCKRVGHQVLSKVTTTTDFLGRQGFKPNQQTTEPHYTRRLIQTKTYI
jgi:hypothetical protein